MLNLTSGIEWSSMVIMHVVNVYGLSLVHSNDGIDKQ